jgi:MFS family permease
VPEAVPTTRLRVLAAAFIGFGAFWGAWAVAAADIERSLGLSHSGFGLLLSIALGIAAITNSIAGSMTERWGTSAALTHGLLVWAAFLVLGALAPEGALAVVLVATIAAGGAVDVIMNVAATAAFADAPGRLVQFHGFFNAGAAAGALATGVLLRAGWSWRWTWGAVGLVAVVLAARVRRTELPASGEGEQRGLTTAVRVVWRERLIVVALAFAIGAMVEGGIETWGVLSLRERVGSGIALGAGAAVVAYIVATIARVSLGPLVASRGAAIGVAAGATLAAGGLVVLAAVNQPVIAACGLVLAAAGISMCWPLLLAHASSGFDRPGDVIGGVTSVGYLGFVVGPSLVGWVAGVAGLRGGLLVLAAAALVVAAAPRARRVRVRYPRAPLAQFRG